MHFLVLFLLAFAAIFWIFSGLQTAWGLLRLPWMKDFAPAKDEDCPRISLLFTARDEEEKLPGALERLAKIDYPNLEIVAVDDRSSDATGRILDEFAGKYSAGEYEEVKEWQDAMEGARLPSELRAGGRRPLHRVRIVHIAELPAGWLGKPHGLQKAYESSSGEWLLFTDADVRFAPDSLRRAVTMVRAQKADHLTLFGDVLMEGFWETVLLTFFGLAMHVGNESHRVSNPNSRAYIGVGAFQLIRRSAYEACGTHKRLAMEVVDDMKLGKMVKLGKFRSCIGVAQEFVSIRWQAGVGNLIRGVTKNFFAALGYRLPLFLAALCGMLLTNVAPFVAMIFGHGWVRGLATVSVVIALGFHAGVDVTMKVSPLYALTHPVGALLFCYMMVRSAVVTMWRGGVEWRGTFYSLEELRKGVV
jgi:glycosyltransferase involved in cell wall biosynthesis